MIIAFRCCLIHKSKVLKVSELSLSHVCCSRLILAEQNLITMLQKLFLHSITPSSKQYRYCPKVRGSQHFSGHKFEGFCVALCHRSKGFQPLITGLRYCEGFTWCFTAPYHRFLTQTLVFKNSSVVPQCCKKFQQYNLSSVEHPLKKLPKQIFFNSSSSSCRFCLKFCVFLPNFFLPRMRIYTYIYNSFDLYERTWHLGEGADMRNWV